MFYVCTMLYENISKDFQETDSNSWVNTRVNANIDTWTDEQAHEWMEAPKPGTTKYQWIQESR